MNAGRPPPPPRSAPLSSLRHIRPSPLSGPSALPPRSAIPAPRPRSALPPRSAIPAPRPRSALPPRSASSKPPPHASISGKTPRSRLKPQWNSSTKIDRPPRSVPYGRFSPNDGGADPQKPTQPRLKPQWNSSTKVDSRARPCIATSKTPNPQVLPSPTSSPIPHIEVCLSPEIKRVPAPVLFTGRQVFAEVRDGRRCRPRRLGDGSVLEEEEEAGVLPSPLITATCDKPMPHFVDGASFGDYSRTPLWMEEEEPLEDFSFEDVDVRLPSNLLSAGAVAVDSFSSVIISLCTDKISVSSVINNDSEDSSMCRASTMSGITNGSGGYDCVNWRDLPLGDWCLPPDDALVMRVCEEVSLGDWCLPPDDALVMGVCEAGSRCLSSDDSLVLGVRESEDWDFTSAWTGNDTEA